MRRLFILVAAIALLTAACKIETNVEVVLNADATGTVASEIGLDEDAQAFLQGQDPFEDVPEGAVTRTEQRGDMTYYIVSQPFSSADQLAELATGEDGLFDTLETSFSGSRVTVRGTTMDSGGGLMDTGDFGELDPGIIEDSFSATIRITMPGRVTDSNADTTDGSTLTWDVPLLGGSIEVRAESDPTRTPSGGGGFPVWLIIVIVVVAAGAAGYVVMSRRKSSAPAAPGFGGAPDPSDPAGSGTDDLPPPPANP